MRRQGRHKAVRAIVACTAFCTSTLPPGSPVRAQTPGQGSPFVGAPGPNETPNPNPVKPATGPFADLLNRSNLLGDMFGLRSTLASKGITYGLTETSELFGNPTGGVHNGVDYNGVTLLSAGLDLDRAFGLRGGTFNVSALEIHGRSISADNLLTIQTSSGIEAKRALRLWELWYDQTSAAGNADIKIGQQSIDQEFMTSTYSSLFVNTALGWPAVPSSDLYAGGPAFPLSSLGVRLRCEVGPFTGQIGVFDDNPPGGSFYGDDMLRGAERTGTAFNPNTGALIIGELLWAVNQPVTGQNVTPGGGKAGLPGTYRIGAWFDTGNFPDQRNDDFGVSLADTDVTDGNPRFRRHDFSAYFSGDQQVWIDSAGTRSVGVFLRTMGVPDDRNLISFSADAGVTLKAPFIARPNDTIGLAYGVAKISARASGFDHDTRTFGDPAYPIRSSESFVELTYQAQIAPWWQIQPDFQYVWMPGGGIANPLKPSGPSASRVGNEAVTGVRTNITF